MGVRNSPAVSYPLPVLVQTLSNLLLLTYNKDNDKNYKQKNAPEQLFASDDFRWIYP